MSIDNSAVVPTSQDGLILRQMVSEADDLEFWELQQANDVHMSRHGNTIGESVDETTQSRLIPGKVRFGIRTNGALAGMTEYVPVEDSEDGHEFEVGVTVAETAIRRGYAEAAVTALVSYMLQQGIDRIRADIHPKNEASRRLFAKLGFVARPKLVQRDWGLAVVMDYVSRNP